MAIETVCDIGTGITCGTRNVVVADARKTGSIGSAGGAGSSTAGASADIEPEADYTGAADIAGAAYFTLAWTDGACSSSSSR